MPDEPGFCDLECWCHVPLRGVSKPPCYLCVINACSLSSKQKIVPSAPDLSLAEETDPFPQTSTTNERAEEHSEVTAVSSVSSSHAVAYGWNKSVSAHTLNTLDQESGLEGDDYKVKQRSNKALVTWPDEPSFQTEPTDNIPIPEPDYLVEASNDEPVDNNIQVPDTTMAVQDNDITSYTGETGSETLTNNLAEMIRNVVLNEDETNEDWNKDEEEIHEIEEREGEPGRHSRIGMRPVVERHRQRRRRDKYRGADKYYSFYETKPYHHSWSNLTRHQSLTINPTQTESEFKQLHRINRRETSSEAARRYLQSDENLHRTWMKQVAVRRRNYPRRASLTRRQDEDNWSLSKWEDMWRLQQS